MVAPQRTAILGVTGSIGKTATALLQTRRDTFPVTVVTAHKNVALLAEQARLLGAKHAVIGDPEGYAALKEALSGTFITCAAGANALVEAALMPSEIVIAAIVGAAGLPPTLAAIQRGARVALANKECLVSAGAFVMQEAKRCGSVILPVDSEHSAIFQLLDGRPREGLASITLTASGGPFRTLSAEQMKKATPAQALCHPTWQMGAKISIDSATMMNKGLEVIEAHHLFALPEARIHVLVHPESVIHGLVTYHDGAVLAQLGAPDMTTPLACALAWPARLACNVPPIDLATLGRLTFEAPDHARFPALGLARAALRTGGSAPLILNAANEVAVARYLAGEIPFTAIVPLAERCLARLPCEPLRRIEDMLELDGISRVTAESLSPA